jgi:proteasome lid subunit RPN8/RPN11
MQLPIETLRDVYNWFRACYPAEGCGLIDRHGLWVPMVNVSPAPERSFRMAPGLVEAHGARAILHSHPGGWRCPSLADMESQAATNIPWGIVWLDEQRIEPPFWWGAQPRDPTGHGWRSGVTDCLNLIRWALGRHGVVVPDVPRRPMDGPETADMLRAHVQRLGGVLVEGDMQAGDILVLGRQAPHLGIVELSGMVWHHPGPVSTDYAPHDLPLRTALDSLSRGGLIKAKWRHQSLADARAA